jgi:multidrug transporter EmrE-like cation transporter
LIVYASLNLQIAVTGVLKYPRIWLILSLVIAAFGFVFLGLWFASESKAHQPVSTAWGYWVVVAGFLSSCILEWFEFREAGIPKK